MDLVCTACIVGGGVGHYAYRVCMGLPHTIISMSARTAHARACWKGKDAVRT